jgi:hypothetical protein
MQLEHITGRDRIQMKEQGMSVLFAAYVHDDAASKAKLAEIAREKPKEEHLPTHGGQKAEK